MVLCHSKPAVHSTAMAPHGGDIIAGVLARHHVAHLFALCGGHISPILTGAQRRGIRVVDVRDEASAVFAAEAVARITGTCGAAAVTAGPGVTNAITAMKNASMAQSPVIVFGGATATLLKGRGALQDIDQRSAMKSIAKWVTSVARTPSLAATVERAMLVATSGVPGPVFVEVPVDVLYPEDVVRRWYANELGTVKGLAGKAVSLYVRSHLFRQFHGPALPDLSRMHALRRNASSATTWDPMSVRDATAARADDSGMFVKRDSSGDRDRAAQVGGRLGSRHGRGGAIVRVADALRRAAKPVIVVGSQALVGVRDANRIARAVAAIGAPAFLAGSARGLLGRNHELQFRHHRGAALRDTDCAIIVGIPFDFRLGYGRSINRRAHLIAANLSTVDLRKNRRPDIAVAMHPGEFLVALAEQLRGEVPSLFASWSEWFESLRARETARDAEIAATAAAAGQDVTIDRSPHFVVGSAAHPGSAGVIDRPHSVAGSAAHPGKAGGVDPVGFLLRLDSAMADDAIIVVDGGDFVATASYIVRPRGPLSWFDPGAFGTLGVGGGFALGAALAKPGREVWLLWGDGSSAYSLAEFDSFVRHGVAPIAVIGNDASWAQIAREQVEVLGTPLGTELRRTDYHTVAEGYGGVGLLISDPTRIDVTLADAQAIARSGRPVCINVHLRPSLFRKGSISI